MMPVSGERAMVSGIRQSGIPPSTALAGLAIVWLPPVQMRLVLDGPLIAGCPGLRVWLVVAVPVVRRTWRKKVVATLYEIRVTVNEEKVITLPMWWSHFDFAATECDSPRRHSHLAAHCIPARNRTRIGNGIHFAWRQHCRFQGCGLPGPAQPEIQIAQQFGVAATQVTTPTMPRPL